MARHPWKAIAVRPRGLLLALTLTTAASCSSAPQGVLTTGDAQSDVAELGLDVDEVLDVVMTEAYYADRIDEPTWRSEATRIESRGAGTEERYDFVRRLLIALGDGHSTFLESFDDAPTPPMYLSPAGEVDAQGIGRLRLPGLVTDPEDTETMQRYVRDAHEVLARAACGWILDLRGDNGGNLFAMLVAVGPLLGPGPTLSYRHRDGDADPYEISSIGALVAEDGTVLAEPASATRFTPDLPIAVLQGASTASAGEGVVMATLGRLDVVSFGRPTAGIPTGNSVFELSDGSAINLTVAIGIDNAGNSHSGPIPPTRATDDPEADAAAWLADHPSCRPAQ